jgi:MFS family permease
MKTSDALPVLEYSPAASGARPGFNWPLISLLTTIATLNYCDRMAIFAVFPLLRADLHADDRTLGWIGSMFLWAYALGSPLSGIIADRWSRTRVILVSLG